MTARPPQSRQGLIASWISQMIGTVVMAAVVIVAVKAMKLPPPTDDSDWKRYAMLGIVLGAAPALAYLRRYKAALDEDERAERVMGRPNPELRAALMKKLVIGGALCEIPMAMGVVQLFFGGEQRWFLGAAVVTIALRLSYRPFNRTPK